MYIKFLKINKLPNLIVYFKNRVKFVNHTDKYIKALYKDPIQLFMEALIENNCDNYWLIIDPLFSTVDKKGKQIKHPEEIYINDGCICGKGSILKYVLKTLLGDNTTIAIYKNNVSISDFKKLDFQNDWEKGKIKVYCECTDAVYWEIISNNKTLDTLKEMYINNDFEATLRLGIRVGM